NVLIYENASGKFVQSATFMQNNSVDPSDPNFIEYYREYSGLQIAGEAGVSGIQVNLADCLSQLQLPQGVYKIITNLISILDGGATIDQIST
ncbi:MAG TPA: hypothetical protein DCM40_44305, partial [Maribacter sp.]|nr:hypothetical protein [Maribacter sp.]